MTDKVQTSTYRPLADRGDTMKWYRFTCMFCDHSQDRCFATEQAMSLTFWNPVTCEECGKRSTPERKEMIGEEKKEANRRRDRIKANLAARSGLFDAQETRAVLDEFSIIVENYPSDANDPVLIPPTECIEDVWVRNRKTIISADRLYRYQLWREWPQGEGFALFIGLNPSTADETNDDPTIRRCINFAKGWGYQSLCMANLFAFRATEPDDMKIAVDPVGPMNNDHLVGLADKASVIVAGWGTNGNFKSRDQEVLRLLKKLTKPISCLGLTSAGMPRHPLYVKADQKLLSFC